MRIAEPAEYTTSRTVPTLSGLLPPSASPRAPGCLRPVPLVAERRIRYAAWIGCDSVDGTKWVPWRDVYLSSGLATVGAPVQLRLQPAGQRPPATPTYLLIADDGSTLIMRYTRYFA